MKNYYEILEISENASPEIIEKAYRTLAKKYHPDVQPIDKLYWAEIQMKEINEAYNVLSNPVSKKQYDTQLHLGNNNIYYQQKYNDLYSENEDLKHQLKANDSYENFKEVQIEKDAKSSKFAPSAFMSKFNFNSYYDAIKSGIYNEIKKPEAERRKDFLAAILTIAIVLTIVLLFWKVPFLNKILSSF